MSAELVKSFEITFGDLTATERKWLIDHIGGIKANADVVLSEENDRLIAALKPFAKIADDYDAADARRTQNRRDEMGGSYVYRTEDSNRVSISMRECRSARTALSSDMREKS